MCNCDGTLQLRVSDAKKQAAAPTWADAHPAPEAAEAKEALVCKALDNSVSVWIGARRPGGGFDSGLPGISSVQATKVVH